jgi:L-ribulose-5-phosphate 3-epimerase UlaE
MTELEAAVAAPAREAVEYEVQVFHTGFHEDFSKYQEISNETDQAWLDLYNGELRAPVI